MSRAPFSPGRRTLIQGAGSVLALALGAAHGHGDLGSVRPSLFVPVMKLSMSVGGDSLLSDLLRGHITALQLMFTGCSATCPIQGALFADLQKKLSSAPADYRLLSLSIDALNDGPEQLLAWLSRFGANSARWRAGVPSVKDVDLLLDFLRARVAGADRHTPQVYLFNRAGHLVYRTTDLPSSREVIGVMQQVAALKG